jgi:hypothetical protein
MNELCRHRDAGEDVARFSRAAALSGNSSEPDVSVLAEMVTAGLAFALLGRWAEMLPTDLPPDLARQHDHYLHGRPKGP